MAKFGAIIVAMFLCVMLIAPHAHGVTCDSVMQSLSPCRSSLQGGAVTEKCCSGMRSLKSAANTAAMRRTACECIKKLARSYKVNSQKAAALTKKCDVNIGYPISNNVDCSKVH